MKNILEQPSDLRDGAIPFGSFHHDDFVPALERAIESARAELARIKSVKDPTFENSVRALELAGQGVSRISSIYFALFNAEADEPLQALAQIISPKLSEYSNDILLDQELFQKIKAVYDAKETLSLNQEEKQLLMESYDQFTQNGALLSDEDKEKLRKIDQELSSLAPQFAENVLKSSKIFELWIEDVEDLKGLPDSVIEAAREAARSKGRAESWLFSLDAPSLVPFLRYSDQRELRKKMWMAYNGRAFGSEYDNQGVIRRQVELRDARAKLLGCTNHSEVVLRKRMARSPEEVFEFLNRLKGAARSAAVRDVEEVSAFAKTLSHAGPIEPWDFNYYSEKLKESRYGFNEEDLRSYFQLENIIDGLFEHGRRLFQLEFKEVSDLPVYHPSVKTIEVKSQETGQYLGLLYLDLFPRPTKKDGAWMCTLREQGLHGCELKRPHVSIVCNFSMPTSTRPSLLTHREVATLFHEFGHALHALLSQCTYPSLSGANVYWDFVELPSQLMENWTKENESLSLFARHFETGKTIPSDLIEKMKASERFQSGFMTFRQLRFAVLDMAWHTVAPSKIGEIDRFEKETTREYDLLPVIEGTNTSCSFSHIFAGGYSSGYYSYKWAEVLEADAFEWFKEKGIFDREVSSRFKREILEKGGTEHPMILYKNFRGREPNLNGLLKRDGLLPPTKQDSYP